MKTKLIAAIAAVLALGSALPANAITIGFAPASQSVSVGSTTTVDLIISGLGDGSASSLGTFDLNVGFDPSVVGFGGAIFGNQLDLFGLGDINTVLPGVGTVNLFELSFESAADLDSLQSGGFTLATLSFTTLGSGNSPLTITLNALGDSVGNTLQADLVAGSITSVGAVPEPATLPLVGIGMLAMIALAMRGELKGVSEQGQ